MNKLPFKIKDNNGLELTITSDNIEHEAIMGGDGSNPDWKEYLSGYKEEYRPHFELIKESIIKLKWVGKTAEVLANDVAFSFSDGFSVGFSWRAWGDLMQAIVNKREGYMAYYM